MQFYGLEREKAKAGGKVGKGRGGRCGSSR